LIELEQDPTEDAFVQDPYRFYERARRAAGTLFHWIDYDSPAVLSFDGVSSLLRDRRLGREAPPGREPEKPPHQAAFWAVEEHSMLELEPPTHTRLRKLVLHAFTPRRIEALAPGITSLTEDLVEGLPAGEFDLLETFASQLPVIVIARLLGIPEEHCDRLLGWSHLMVTMYQARRTRDLEVAASEAAREFSAFLTDYIEFRRRRPEDDLITELIEAEEAGERLSTPELIATCILLLNAGHEATVHTIGNGVAALLERGDPRGVLGPERIDGTVEEILRFDTPLHMFSRWAYEDVEIDGHRLPAGSRVACLLGAANRDPDRWSQAERFDPLRPVLGNASFGAGIHFCLGAPLARLELRVALPLLFAGRPGLSLVGRPRYAPTYHFHGLERLVVRA